MSQLFVEHGVGFSTGMWWNKENFTVIVKDAVSRKYCENCTHMSIVIYILSHSIFYKTRNRFSQSYLKGLASEYIYL